MVTQIGEYEEPEGIVLSFGIIQQNVRYCTNPLILIGYIGSVDRDIDFQQQGQVFHTLSIMQRHGSPNSYCGKSCPAEKLGPTIENVSKGTWRLGI